MIKKRLLSLILSLSLSVASIVPAFAMDYAYTVDDADNSVETVVYDEPDEDTSVYAQVGSTFKVQIPKIIVLSGKTKQANYKVGVKGDIGGLQYIQIVTEPTFWLFDVSGVKDPEKGFNTRPKSIFVSSDLGTVPADAVNGVNEDTYVESEGMLECSTITAGKWHSQIDFYIGLFDDFTDIVPIASDGTMLELTASDLYIGEEFQGLKPTDLLLSDALTTELLENREVADELDAALHSNLSATRSLNTRSLTRGASEDTQEVNTIKTLEEALANAKALQANKEIVYESDNERIRVNSDGKVYLDGAVAGDKATITATYKGVFDSQIPGVNDRDDIKIDIDVTVYRIDLTDDELYLDLGDTASVTASLYPSYVDEEIIWNTPEMLEGVSFASSASPEGNVTTMSINVANDAIDDNNGELVAAVRDEYDNSARIVINPTHKHEYRVSETKASACTEQGYTTYVCDGCDEETEGHTYTDYEPALGHECSDGHWCDRCDKLIYPYRYTERVYKKVAGQTLEFVCVDPNYTNQAGQTGAYFLSKDVVRGLRYNTAGTAAWATASARTVLNGSNSDKTHVSLTNTTVKTAKDADCINGGRNMKISDFNMHELKASEIINSEDYYFIPSIEELVDHNWWTWDPVDGDSSQDGRWKDTNWYNPPIFAYWTRTGCYENGSYRPGKLAFVYPDAGMITNTSDTTNDWFPTTYFFDSNQGGARVAFMAFQESDEQIGGNDWHCDDVLYRTINGEQVKFICADEHYKDAEGNDVGAMFVSTKIFDSRNSIYDDDSNVWATSKLREYMSTWDSEGLVKVNTTPKSAMLKENTYNWHACQFWYEDGIQFEDNASWNIGVRSQANPETSDYYFVMSVEEAQKLQNLSFSSTGQRRDLNEQWSQYAYGVALRTPVADSTDNIGYISIDARYYNFCTDKKCYSNAVGFRPCFVVAHKD